MRVLSVFLFLLLFPLFSSASPPPSGKKVYTVQVASFTDRKEAEKVLERVCSFPDARIAFRNGRYKVRVGFFKSFSEAEKFVNGSGLLKVVSDYYVTRITFSPEGVIFCSGKVTGGAEKESRKGPAPVRKKEEKKEKAGTETPPPVSGVTPPSPDSIIDTVSYEEVPRLPEKKEQEKAIGVKKEKREVFSYRDKVPGGGGEKREKRWPYLLGAGAGALVLFILLRRFKRERFREEPFESYLARLLDGGRYEEIVDLAVSYLAKNPGDIFVKKALAESYERLGSYLEAARLYSEIASELEEKGLGVLAGGFRERAEELYGREFKRG